MSGQHGEKRGRINLIEYRQAAFMHHVSVYPSAFDFVGILTHAKEAPESQHFSFGLRRRSAGRQRWPSPNASLLRLPEFNPDSDRSYSRVRCQDIETTPRESNFVSGDRRLP